MSETYDSFFQNLYLEQYKRLLGYAYRLTGERNFSEEIVQDAFTEAYRRIELLYRHENPAGWLYLAVRNISKAYLRELIAMKRNIPLEKARLAAAEGPGDGMLLLAGLTEPEAGMIRRFYIEHASLRDLSREYGISLSACKMRLKRAREKLKKTYETGQ